MGEHTLLVEAGKHGLGAVAEILCHEQVGVAERIALLRLGVGIGVRSLHDVVVAAGHDFVGKAGSQLQELVRSPLCGWCLVMVLHVCAIMEANARELLACGILVEASFLRRSLLWQPLYGKLHVLYDFAEHVVAWITTLVELFGVVGAEVALIPWHVTVLANLGIVEHGTEHAHLCHILVDVSLRPLYGLIAGEEIVAVAYVVPIPVAAAGVCGHRALVEEPSTGVARHEVVACAVERGGRA